MTDERRRQLDALQRYVDQLKPLLRLQAWDVKVGTHKPETKECVAECRTRGRTWEAEIRFNKQHFRDTREEQRNTVIHELLHLHSSGWYAASREAFESLDSTPRAWANERCDYEHERMVDALSRVLAPHLPLPDDVTTDERE